MSKTWIYILVGIGVLALIYRWGKQNGTNARNQANADDLEGLNGDGGLLTPGI